MEQHLIVQVHGVLIMRLLKMLKFLMLIIVHHLTLAIERILFSARWRSKKLRQALVHIRKRLVLNLAKKTQCFA